ncbi:MAG: gliding motility-associated C-terminal domain-containing protein [Saprospiraceae bacterium]|nr:gliding motility-associated C-terminal domain-containing protein [Saprospiraceae bacterium]
MQQKLLLLLSLFSLIWTTSQAQVTPPCPTPPPPGATSCPATCVYCNYDGYTGINNTPNTGGALVCGQITLHNDVWFGFVAGTTSITIDILTSNCQNGDGLQAAFFDDCNGAAIDCNAGVGGGAGVPLTLSYSGFVPGQTYYLMIDGYIADVCNFEIDVTDGSVTPPPPDVAQPPQGPTEVCPGAVVEYTVPEIFGAGYYNWTSPAGSKINGGTNSIQLPASEGTTVTITFGSAGGNVCVTVGNACYPPTTACLPVTNKPIPATQLQPITLCFEDLPYEWAEEPHNLVTNAGTFNLTSTPYDSYLGCDSTIKQTIIVKNQITKNIGLKYICEGTCFNINNSDYCDAGSFQEVFDSYQGCDSIVQFTVIIVPATAAIAAPPTITCSNNTVLLSSTGSSSGPNIFYAWYNSSGTQIGNQATQPVSTGGNYTLVVSGVAGGTSCRDTAMVTVPTTVVSPGAAAQGGMLSCLPNGNSVVLQGTSPSTGVNYQWAGPGITPANTNQQNPAVTVQGTYTLTVTNPTTGCSSTSTAVVSANNTPPTASAVGTTITCTNPTITIDASTDALPPAYVWTGPGINAGNMNVQDPPVNVGGTYTVTITNTASGCTNTASVTVAADVTIPTASAGANQTITCQQLSLTLNGSGSPANVTYLWTGPGITPANETQATPTVNQPGTFILTVTNPTNGCIKADTAVVDATVNPPNVDAGANQVITCGITSVVIGGSGSSQGANFQANWAGPGINAGNATLFTPTVSLPGDYTITVSNNTNGCTATDVVTIGIDVAAPSADAGTDQILTCTSTNGVTLSGSGTPANLTYLWSGPGIGSNNETQQNPIVTQPGTYSVTVTNPTNGCTAVDQAIVTQDANVPQANAGADLELNCTVSAVNINAAGSSSGVNIVYEWTGPGITPANATVQSPTGITAPGTYDLMITDVSNNCVNHDIVVITIDTILPAANAGADLVLNCYNNGADSLFSTGSSTGANFTLQWTGAGIQPGDANNPTPVVAVAGTYDLVITNTQNTCTSTDQVTVSADLTAPTADAGTDQIIDCVKTSTLVGGASSSGANFTYSWTGPGINAGNQTLAQPTVSVQGNYTLLVSNTTNGCTSTDDISVVLDAVYPTTLAGPDQVLTCANPTQTLNGAGSSNGPDFQTQWTGPDINAGNANVLSPSITLPGTYILAITNSLNSCLTQDTVLITEDKVAPAVSAGPDQGLDCAVLSVVLDGSGSASGPGITYTWSGLGITPGTAGQQSPSVTEPDVYTVVVLNTGNGCTSTDDVAIVQDIVAPTASAGQAFTLTCADAVQSIDGSGSSVGALFTYLWQGPGINTSNFSVQNPMVSDSGTYLLTVTNIQNKCTSTAQVTIDMDANAPLIDAGPDQTLTCKNDTLLLDGTSSASGADISYTWTGPGVIVGTETSSTPQVSAPGSYTLTVLNAANGCTATDIAIVGTDFAPPIADAGPTQLLTCSTTNGVSLSAAGSNTGAGYSLLWSGPGITTGNEAQVMPTVLSPGVYTVVVTNTNNGCTSSSQVTVNLDQNLPNADAGTDQTITCSVTTVSLDASASSGNGTLTYQWAGPGISATNQTEVAPDVVQAGTYTVTVTNNQTGCSATATVEVLLDNTPALAGATGGIITCTALDVTLASTSSLPGSTFIWSGPDINAGNMNQQNPQVGEPGNYTVVVTALNGCTSTASATVGIDANVPQGSAGEDTQLNCLNNGISTITGQINTPGATFAWSGPGGFNANTLMATVVTAGTYVLTIQSPNGCSKPYDVEVTADFTKPNAVATVNDLLDCSTTSVTINSGGTSVGPNFTYAWTTSDGNIASGANTLTPVADAAGVYTLLVTNLLNGCTNTGTVTVVYDQAVPTAMNLTVKNIRCFGETSGFIAINSVVGGTQPFVYSLNGAPASGTGQFSQLGAGDYQIVLEDSKGCTLDTLVSISAPGALQVSLEDDLLVELGTSITVNATVTGTTPVSTITWNPPANCPVQDCLSYDTLPTHSYLQTITVVDINGCTSVDKQLIQVDRTRRIFVPNVFNPDSNNPLNSFLMIQGGNDIREIKTWQVFDRWGNAVYSQNNFQPNDPTYAWDGKIRGDNAHVAVYVWYVEVEFVDGQIEQFKGDVSLIR